MMRSIAIERGYDMDAHIAHQLVENDVAWATHVLAFDLETLEAVRKMFPAAGSKLRLFSSDGTDVVDPYGQSESVFQDCFDRIEAEARRFLEQKK